MDRDELILQKLSELAEDVKDLRKNVGGLQKDITDVKLQQADDRRRSELRTSGVLRMEMLQYLGLSLFFIKFFTGV